ncbi:MAG TPA: DUF4350 domain-containing protein [Blastocatellia bacterium]|nr:DUF4350 domain-containing protein [Blastocatellia bacterium]
MKRSRGIVVVLLLFGVLVLLNFLFFVDNRGASEGEENGNRSSYLSSPYGTMAYYNLLEQSGLPVVRYTRSYKLLNTQPNIGTLIVIAPPIGNNPTPDELKSLAEWVEAGGLLIVIDRAIFIDIGAHVSISTSPADGGSKLGPLQPASYAEGVQHVDVTEYATRVNLKSPSTVDYIGDNQGAILAGAKAGKGKVLCLTEPYIVANNGIGKADNLAVALNILGARPPGQIAFDEYHHGYGSDGLFGGGGLLGYFHGTPVPWIVAQIALIGLLLIYNQGRRFGRPTPVRQDKRTTNLEFVSSMATITRLARATGLAMQNIYGEFHRRLCRYCGMPSNTSNARLAAAASRRGTAPEPELMDVLVRCGQVAGGAYVSDAEMLDLVSRIRAIESKMRV